MILLLKKHRAAEHDCPDDTSRSRALHFRFFICLLLPFHVYENTKKIDVRITVVTPFPVAVTLGRVTSHPGDSHHSLGGSGAPPPMITAPHSVATILELVIPRIRLERG